MYRAFLKDKKTKYPQKKICKGNTKEKILILTTLLITSVNIYAKDKKIITINQSKINLAPYTEILVHKERNITYEKAIRAVATRQQVCRYVAYSSSPFPF